jgi:hypothetical protein
MEPMVGALRVARQSLNQTRCPHETRERIAQAVGVTRLVVSAHKVLTLSLEERFGYYMLGHFFNELMFLQKLLGFALPKHDDDRPLRQQPEMGQALFLFRTAAGKVWEAKLSLAKVNFARVLNLSFLPLLPGASDRLKTWQRRVAAATWMSRLRDRHSFHYPTYEQWRPLLETSGVWQDDDIFMGAQSGNTFYASSDAMVQHWMFGQLNQSSPRDAVEPMIDELISLLADFNSLVEDLLGAFISERLLQEAQATKSLGSVAGPEFHSVTLPFWTHMTAKR